ncbi:MAG: glycoside hydrolase family 2, partial [Verrucomicrobiae bacterium]|nr:glycoside hydrolase family 2 [Verrucomicrobiae bacterium]
MKHAVLLIPFALAATVVAWQPAPDSMLTEWGEQVTPENAWREYPRPQMQRDQWTNLNGLWEYAVTKESDPARPSAPDGQILVPFAIESALSGVKRSFQPDDVLWYRRTFELEPRPGRRYLLNFEAVDYQCTVRVNHREVGRHTGGNLPFSLDITEAVTAGVNTVLVRVTDATDTAHQLHGKQRLDPKGIWYTPVSGIWQTVWLEEVPTTSFRDLKIVTDASRGTIAVTPAI